MSGRGLRWDGAVEIAAGASVPVIDHLCLHASTVFVVPSIFGDDIVFADDDVFVIDESGGLFG
jgi:hypothetical protein